MSKKDFKFYMGTTTLEEFVHAAQYDWYVHKYGRLNGSRSCGDDEFEAKVVVGMILKESHIESSIKSFDLIPTDFGKNITKDFNQEEYNNTKHSWMKEPITIKAYGNLKARDTDPQLLKNLNNK